MISTDTLQCSSPPLEPRIHPEIRQGRLRVRLEAAFHS